MFDSIEDTYNDIKNLLDQKSFFIQAYEKSISFCIKKQQIGIQYDIVFPLTEGSVDIKEIVSELCEKNIQLEKKVDVLTERIIILENKINEINGINSKIQNLENQIKNIKSNKNELIELNENISINDGLTNDERKRIKSLFDNSPKKFNLLYKGLDREEFFKKCNGKNNLLFLVNDVRGEKYGGFMSSKLIKNEEGKCKIIRDENSFIFNLNSLKKFKVKKPERAILIYKGYIICFGGEERFNDFFINDKNYYPEEAGSFSKESYGDIKHETTNSFDNCKINELKIFQIYF